MSSWRLLILFGIIIATSNASKSIPIAITFIIIMSYERITVQRAVTLLIYRY